MKNLLLNRGIIIVIVISVISFFALQKYQDSKNLQEDRTDCYTELNKEVSGVVVRSFFDENPYHKGFEIEFTNGTKYRPRYLKNWQSVILDKGDSISKKSGTFKVVIYRKKYDNPIMVINDSIDCNKLFSAQVHVPTNRNSSTAGGAVNKAVKPPY